MFDIINDQKKSVNLIFLNEKMINVILKNDKNIEKIQHEHCIQIFFEKNRHEKKI